MSELIVCFPGVTAAFFVVLMIIVETAFLVRPDLRIGAVKCILLSQVIAFLVVSPALLLFTDHPRYSGVWLWEYFILLPPSIIAAFSVALLYRPGNHPLLGRTTTLTILSLMVIGLLSWIAMSLPKQLSPQSTGNTNARYPQASQRHMSKAQAELDAYRKRGLIQPCQSNDNPSVICVDGTLWRKQSKDMQLTVFQHFMRLYSALGHGSILDVIDRETGEVYARSTTGKTGIEIEIR